MPDEYADIDMAKQDWTVVTAYGANYRGFTVVDRKRIEDPEWVDYPGRYRIVLSGYRFQTNRDGPSDVSVFAQTWEEVKGAVDTFIHSGGLVL